MAKQRGMGEEDLKALVANEIRASVTHDDAELSKKRAEALAYYMGQMEDLTAEPGRSSVVSRDVADTIGWMLPGIIRVFTASDQMAICEPVGPEDEEWSDQATDGINYVFWKDNPGYKILYNATWDSLLLKNGIVKHWWDDTEETEVSEHSGITDDQLAQLVGDGDDIEVLTHTAVEETEVAQDPETGESVEVPVTLHDVKINRIKSSGRIRIECIPPEDFLLDKDADCIEEARFVGHKDRVSRSDLIEMGFDRSKVDGLKASTTDDPEGITRGENDETGVAHESMTLVDLTECYVKADMDGDGIAETVRCYYAGNQSGGVLLDWEIWEDDVPFSDIPCNPLPHRWEAESVADETMDVQRVKTVLTRQALDNIYASNIPTRYVEGDVSNPDELYSPSFGGVIFGRAGTKVTDLSVPFVANHAFDAINYQDQVIERRTGVSRTTMALDPEVLQNQTATANQNAKDAAYSQIELIARNQAELGWSRVFRAILKLMVKHQDKPRTIRLRNKWVEIDPRHWNADMDVTVNVGLGTGSRDRDLAMLNVILGNQMALVDRMVENGMGDIALTMLPKIIHTLGKITESAGMKSPDQFFPEVDPDTVQKLVKRAQEQMAQGDPKLQIEAQKARFEMQKEEAKLQAEAEAKRMEMQLKREQIEAEMALKRDQLQAELQLKREEMAAEMALKREMGMMNAAVKRDVGLSSDVQVGGNPG